MLQRPLPGHGALNPYGVLVHTTGDGLARKCLDDAGARDHLEIAAEVYGNMKEGPHYCIAPSGAVVQFRQPTEIAYHAAVSEPDRAAYLSGAWELNGRTPKAIVDWWKLQWPGFKSPQHLYPAKSPNQSYIGVELIPCGVYQRNTWTPIMGTPATPKSRFTAEQYTTLAALCSVLGREHSWPVGWWNTPRLAGHEDVDPKDRPGWDVGVYHGWFSRSLLRGMVSVLSGEVNQWGQK